MNLLNNIRISTIGWVLFGVLVVSGGLFVTSSLIAINNVSMITVAWDKFEANRSQKATTLNALHREIGYGGMIHQFKNYVLRQDQARIAFINAQLGGSTSVLARYRSLDLNKIERQAIEDIKKVLDLYAKALIFAVDLTNQGKTPLEIDRLVRVDDRAAIRGLDNLKVEAIKKAGRLNSKMSKSQLVSNLRNALGYGGMIHKFKNVVLRRQQAEVGGVRKDITTALSIADQFFQSKLNHSEKRAIGSIVGVIQAYELALKKVEKLIQQDELPSAIDKAVKIDDRPALDGFDLLTKEIVKQNNAEALKVKDALTVVALVSRVSGLTTLVLLGLIGFGTLWLIRGQIIRPIASMTAHMNQLADGKLDIHLPVVDQTNEIGEMARAIEVFKNNALQRELAEEFLNQLSDAMPVHISKVDLDRRYLYVNKEYERWFNLQKEEILGKTVAEIFGPEVANQTNKYSDEVLSGKKISYETTFTDFAGNKCDFQVIYVPYFQQDQISGYYALALDISENKTAQKSLEFSERRFRDFAESAADRFWEMDSDFRYTYVSNPTNALQLGESQILGKFLWEIEGFNVHQGSWDDFRKVLNDRKPIKDLKYYWENKDHEKHYISINAVPYFDDGGNFKGYRGTSYDETNTLEVQLMRDRFFEAMENLDAGFVLWDSNKKLLAFNSAFKNQQREPGKILEPGIDYQEYIQKIGEQTIKNGGDIEDLDKWVKNRLSEFDSPSTDREVQNVRGDWIRIRKQRLADGSILSFHQDISDIKEHETRLNAAIEVAEHANQAKSQFLSSMSHELRTPLNAILGFGQLLENNPKEPLSAPQISYTQQILKGGDHLLELIDQVLELSKIESGNITLTFENVAPEEIIDECLNLVGAQANDNKITIEFTKPDIGLPLLSTDSTRLRQVFLNLLSNAVKYNREGGKIIIASEHMEKDRLRISVSDTGLGIPKAKQKRLFEPFNRLGRESGEIEGTGIGLTITKQITELMGGQIGFESEENIGSTFWVEIPISNDQKIEAGHADNDSFEADSESKNVLNTAEVILYIEDNPANIRLMEAIVERLPSTTLKSAHTAELGLDLARELVPDLIFMDINLPAMNGIEAVAELRKIEETKDIPVIAISAAAMPKDIERGKEAGFKKYITKPIKVPEILEAINEYSK
ncbi:MAG: response regulator [Rhodospirillaceae bacterium]|jgi:PAS domain S-box-containing protein|nr:response regulator [Rhodospirillaceae bacterium]MBT7266407.1 response regulator [Rhodospirillaceae bacterium]